MLPAASDAKYRIARKKHRSTIDGVTGGSEPSNDYVLYVLFGGFT
jgi:hypothetical protein